MLLVGPGTGQLLWWPRIISHVHNCQKQISRDPWIVFLAMWRDLSTYSFFALSLAIWRFPGWVDY